MLSIRSSVEVEVERAVIDVTVQGVVNGAAFALERNEVKDLCFSSGFRKRSVNDMLITREGRFDSLQAQMG